MSNKICLFAGTTEGRLLAELLRNATELTVCVATDYGEKLLDKADNITVHTERMDEKEMTEFFSKNGFDLIIDATHPFAKEVTANIKAAAEKNGIRVMRVLRNSGQEVQGAKYVSCVKEARDFLKGKKGNILITTGSKEISSYEGLDMSRVWARVLPSIQSIVACQAAGIETSHIIAAQGPFSYGANVEQLKMINAKYMVTKDSGKNGGSDNKISAAVDSCVTAVIIGQPAQTDGLSMDEAICELEKMLPIPKRKIYIIGIGPGSRNMLTPEAEKILNECDAVLGAQSVVNSLNTSKPTYYEYMPENVLKVLNDNASIRRAAVVMRGDTGFFSGTKKLIEALKGQIVEVVPGVCSVSLLAARLGVSWDDAALLSVHGREQNIIYAVNTNKKTFILIGGEQTVKTVCKKLCDYSFDNVKITVGERLSLSDEKITSGSALELSNKDFDSLAVMYIENPDAKSKFCCGIPDEEFIRGEVPMTKSEIRAVSMSKLALSKDSVVWDIGAGTGSVSVECALTSFDGKVFAIEKKSEAVELIRKNKIKFCTDNLTVIEGTAPEALKDLQAPTHAFIGGSSGNLREIISVLLKRNPDVRIVINTITLESQSEVSEIVREFGFREFECVSVNVSRSHKTGNYNLMISQNPVCVFVLHGGAGRE